MNKLVSQIIKFLFVGGTAFIIDYSLLYILTEFIGFNYIISAAISFIISTIYNYIASMYWVFVSKYTSNRQKELKIFILLSISGLIINQILLAILVEQFYIHYMISKIVVTIIVMIWNFITRKIFLEERV
ncbi:GtrA family protein [Pisciglobus halotolerans]|uniref:Putative flippase GtrA (Transmembrane translocase of bactoprenol-linked glucose) n=1 Tax=Pisciglobus halotolerans TaxID=745365 RepID=A0A1I3E668_9LACT|nr:GtrA family protein [Pisciglobus halotolerans]SFH94191.1 Putative flippase GtrA (transmembrane translocase of bactoprenol-linked glucose) [Pisciglobus halotolerans]